jgi:hypothetical protein
MLKLKLKKRRWIEGVAGAATVTSQPAINNSATPGQIGGESGGNPSTATARNGICPQPRHSSR